MKDTINIDQCLIRWTVRGDLSECVKIEQACFDFPWDEEEFIRCLKGQSICLVAELKDDISQEKQIVAFMIYKMLEDKIILENIAVHPEYQRQGIGRKMIEKLINKMKQCRRRQELITEVRETDIDTQIFLRKMDFCAVPHLSGYLFRLSQVIDNPAV
ncbi:MAG: GNAT family N-acetyltransferase [Planctomycetaceae bacterium]|jgi:ribosomal-protein-alanine N-acetyltransferase|nr:GNAT family N-acetyltransferase [Planctomycetaceae bacterium]